MALDWQRKMLLIQAFFLTGFTRLALSRRSFKELVAGLGTHSAKVECEPLEAAALKTARAVGWAVRASSSRTPWESTCLVQVLTAQKMLKKRGVPGVFYLGATNAVNENNASECLAHAWLKCGGEFITGESGHQQYTVISSFSW